MWPKILLLSLVPLVLAEELRLFHRIYEPLATTPANFLERGVLSLSPEGSAFAPTENFAADLLEFGNIAQESEGAFYQIALEREGDANAGHWSVSSVKACHLPKSTTDTILVHKTSDGKAFALDYFVAPIPQDGSCPQAAPVATQFLPAVITTIHVQSSRLSPLPQLRTPPPLTPQGEPVVPIPEKSFIAKYWIYILIVLGALLLTGGAEEEAPKEAGR